MTQPILAAAIVLALLSGACAGSATTTTGEAASPPSTIPATTTAPEETTTTSTASTTTVATSEEDADAIKSAYEIVFSSETDFAEKSPLIDDPAGLEETVLDYQETGESMGGVSLKAKKITVDGATAKVIYDLLFGGTPTYPDLTGDAVLVDGTWKVTRTMFCSIMTSARVGCPSP